MSKQLIGEVNAAAILISVMNIATGPELPSAGGQEGNYLVATSDTNTFWLIASAGQWHYSATEPYATEEVEDGADLVDVIDDEDDQNEQLPEGQNAPQGGSADGDSVSTEEQPAGTGVTESTGEETPPVDNTDNANADEDGLEKDADADADADEDKPEDDDK